MQQPSIITGLGRTPIIDAIIPPPVTTTPLERTTRRVPAPLPQEQEQKKQIIKPGTDFITNLFISYTFRIPDLQRRVREGKVKDLVIDPLELSPPTPIVTTAYDNNNNCKKKEQANLSTENTNVQQKEKIK